jgi:hypothetical protein
MKLIQLDKDESIKAVMNPLPALEAAGVMPSVAALPDSGKKKRKVADCCAAIFTRDYQADAKKVQGKSESNRIEMCRICLAAVEEARQQVHEGKTLVNPMKSWLYRNGKVVDCIKSCHGGSIEAFLAINQVTFSKFTCCSKGVEHKATFDFEAL